MRRMYVLTLVVALCSMFGSAYAAVIFSDDFSGDLSKWTVSGPAGGLPYITETDELQLNSGVAGEPWGYTASTVDQWTTAGTYELQFDVDQAHTQSYEAVRVYMPGGLSLFFTGLVSNPPALCNANIYYKDTYVSTITGVNWYGWNNFKMISDGRDVSVYMDGDLKYSGTMASDPDFQAYDDIFMWAKAVPYTALFDNVVLSYVPEPATLCLLTFGAFGLIRRRK